MSHCLRENVSIAKDSIWLEEFMCHINKGEMKIKQTASDSLSKIIVALLFLSTLTQVTHFTFNNKDHILS